jgi:NitT/TauT family transport system permease protein
VEIVTANWEILRGVSPVYDSSQFVSEALLNLIPEGKKKIARPSYLPAPHEVFGRMRLDFTGRSPLGDLQIWERYLSSLGVVFGGYFLAVLVGLPLALLAGTFPFFSKLTEPFADFFRYMPAPAFGVVLMAVFGIYQAPKYALVFLGTFPHAILMIAKTTRLLDRSLLDAAQTLGASKAQLLKRVVIPGVLPNVYNDLRILLGWAWTWLVIAELIGEKSGLTSIIDTQGRRFHFETVYPIILLIGLTGFLSDQVLSGLRSLLFPWEAEGRQGVVAKAALALTWLPRRVVALAPHGGLRAAAREISPEPSEPEP